MAQTHKVEIKNMKFNPESIIVAKGDTVEWMNLMGMAHTVAPNNDEFPGSGAIGQNARFSHLFDIAGTIDYHCEIHPFMTGKVVVT